MSQDRTEELKAMLAVFDSRHEELLRKGAFWIGRRQMKVANNALGMFVMKNYTSKLLAYLIVEKQLFGVKKGRKDDLLEIALNWLAPSIWARMPTEIGEAGDERVVVYRTECTVGFKGPECAQLCRASMNMDMEIVRRLGGRLEVTETILEGAPKCKHILTKGD